MRIQIVYFVLVIFILLRGLQLLGQNSIPIQSSIKSVITEESQKGSFNIIKGYSDIQFGNIAIKDSANVSDEDNYEFYATGAWLVPDDSYISLYFDNNNFAPPNAIVTRVRYVFFIDDTGDPNNFYCGDYEVWLSSSSTQNVYEEINVYDNLGSSTDEGFDDDWSNDSDIDTNWGSDRETHYFDDELANQYWGMKFKDTYSQNEGQVENIGIRIYWETSGQPNLTADPSNCTLSVNGTNVDMNVRVINNGGSSASSSHVGYYLSTNETFTTSDYLIGDDYVSSLSPGGYSDESISIDVTTVTPNIPADTYYIGFIIDYQDEVSESDENDNDWHWSSPQVTISNQVPDIDVNPTSLTITQNSDNYSNQIEGEVKDNAYVQPIDIKYIIDTIVDINGDTIFGVVVPGYPPKDYFAPAVEPTKTSFTLPNTPAYDWSFGCSATSAAMMAGYYDNNGFPNMYTGPTNGGVAPMTNSVWGSVIINGETRKQCPISATRQGLDGRTIFGHVDDYWILYGNSDPDPYIGNWTQHTYGECTGDYMKTNQSVFNNTDGATTFYFYSNGNPISSTNDADGCYGAKLFFESRSYTVDQYFTQLIYGYNGNTQGFTFNQFKQEIDDGRPVLIQVTGHTMLGYGYDDINNIIYIHDTWDYSNHEMTWAGSYSGLTQWGVSVINISGGGTSGDNFVISNNGNGLLSISSITPNQSWLILSGYPSGTFNILPGNSQNVTVDIDWSQLSTQQTGAITITSNDPDEPSVTVSVTAIPTPPAPSSLTATAVSSSQINVSWSNVSNEDGYKIYRATSSGGSYSQIDTTGTNVTSYSDNGLPCNTLYCYKVKAYNIAGDSGFSPYDCDITDDCPCDPPTSLSATPTGQTTANLDWSNVSGAIGYEVRYKPTSSSTWITNTTSGSYYSASDLTCGTTYDWEVRTNCGSGSYSSWVTGPDFTTDDCPCNPPTSLTVNATGQTTAEFDWSDVSGALGYDIRYKQVSGSTWTTHTITTSSYTASDLTCGTTYEWEVRTACGFGNYSSWISGPNFTTDDCPCNPPTSLTVNATGQTTAEFDWSDVSGALGYNIRYKQVSGTIWTTQTTNISSYSVSGLTCETTYQWEVRTDCGSGSYSNWELGSNFTTDDCITGTPPTDLTGPSSVTVGQNIHLEWIPPYITGEYIEWDNGINAYGIGLSGGTFSAASHWTPADLSPYGGYYLSKIKFWPRSDPAASFTVKVWTGAYGTTVEASQDVTSFTPNQCNEVILDNPVLIDASQDLWFGYTVTQGNGTHPAGCDNGPAIQQKGDMISFGGAWSSMSTSLGYDYNWNIAGFVGSVEGGKMVFQPITIEKSPVTPGTSFIASGTIDNSLKLNPDESKDFLGYNVYRDGTNIAYVTNNEYDEVITVADTYEYYVTAVYDEGESGPSNTINVNVNGTYLPDLIISEHNINPSSLHPGENLSMQITIKNIGAALASTSVARFYLSYDTIYQPSDIELGSVTTPALNINQISNKSKSVTINESTIPGLYYILFYTDADQIVIESNEANNLAYSLLTIEEEPGDPPYLYTYPDSLTLECALGSNKAFLLTSNIAWEIHGKPSWIDISDVSGLGNKQITITANSTNPYYYPQQDTLEIVGDTIILHFPIKQEVCTGVEEKHQTDIDVYPNPSKDKIYIKITNPELFVEKIELLDMPGKVMSINIINTTDNVIEIPVVNFKPGVYFIKLYTSKGIITRKIIIQQ